MPARAGGREGSRAGGRSEGTGEDDAALCGSQTKHARVCCGGKYGRGDVSFDFGFGFDFGFFDVCEKDNEEKEVVKHGA